MKRIMIMLAVVAMAMCAKAQLVKSLDYPKMHYGVRAAVTYNTFQNDVACAGHIFGSAGVAGDYKLMRNVPLYVETGLYYMNKARKVKKSSLGNDDVEEGTGGGIIIPNYAKAFSRYDDDYDNPDFTYPDDEDGDEGNQGFWGMGRQYNNHGVVMPILLSYHLYLNDNMAIQPFAGPYIGYFFNAKQVDYGFRGGVGFNSGRAYINAGCDYGMEIEHRQAFTLFLTIGFNLEGLY